MTTQPEALLVGGTGRTGRRVLEQLLARGVRVRAIVRSRGRVPAEAAGNPKLTLVEADLLSLSAAELEAYVGGCEAMISCLGHTLTFKGVFGQPRDLVTQATARLCRAVEAAKPAAPVKFILLSSVSVQRAGGLDTRRGGFEQAFMRLLCALLPPAGDNQRAAALLSGNYAPGHPCVQWTAVRPDSLVDGPVAEYTLHEGLVSSLFAPDSTNMANVAHFMCELVTDATAWERWRGKLPVIINAAARR
jgi:nucleoside-diphosphate-sugar epimerase